MGSDSIANAAFTRENGKKKRANRFAKLKQCKLDVRREQWLSQVKNKVGDESNRVCSSPQAVNPANGRNAPLEHIETRALGEARVSESDLESPTNSLDSSNSDNPLRKDCPHSSSVCVSGSVSEDDDGDGDGGFDDWEAVADALSAGENCQHPNSESPPRNVTNVESNVRMPASESDCGEGILKPEWKRSIPRASTMSNCRAWRPDDTFRPQSLPNLSKQYTFPLNAERHCIHGSSQIWGCHNISAQPPQCPICCEELDITDSSFLPCSCGFRLCLFCHKRILEADGRCPGCRKQYGPVDGQMGVHGGPPPLRSARFCSMSSRS